MSEKERQLAAKDAEIARLRFEPRIALMLYRSLERLSLTIEACGREVLACAFGRGIGIESAGNFGGGSMSERYEVWEPHKNNHSWRIWDTENGVMKAMFSCSFPDAEARARQLCAELNAKEAEREGARRDGYSMSARRRNEK